MKALQARMVSSAIQNGLVGGVSDESVELLLYGLDCHLKNIISNMINKVRSNRGIGIPVQSIFPDNIIKYRKDSIDGLDSHKLTKYTRLCERIFQSKNTLKPSDLTFSLNLSPFVTVETPSCLEQTVMTMSRQEIADSTINRDNKAIALSKSRLDKSRSHFQDGELINLDRLNHPESNQNIFTVNDGISNISEQIDFEIIHSRLKSQYERHYGPFINTNITPEA